MPHECPSNDEEKDRSDPCHSLVIGGSLVGHSSFLSWWGIRHSRGHCPRFTRTRCPTRSGGRGSPDGSSGTSIVASSTRVSLPSWSPSPADRLCRNALPTCRSVPL